MTTNTETPPKASLCFGKEAVKNTIRKNMRILCFTLGILFLIPVMPAQAGGINAEEQRLINEASGRFTYAGKTYKAKDSYLELLKEKLSEEDLEEISGGSAGSFVVRGLGATIGALEYGAAGAVSGMLLGSAVGNYRDDVSVDSGRFYGAFAGAVAGAIYGAKYGAATAKKWYDEPD